jgi:hypothetical protein
VEAHPDDRAAIALVATIDELFVIDASPVRTRRKRLLSQESKLQTNPTI